ncbi:MAG: DNA/RNA nuclease SfsA [Deltaproteobacteria bacterium]|nr:MAG: DNA/RNA nuclease SfsA [Deltaproteobacteria bacterium]
MNYPYPLLDATLLRRYKRFLADVRLSDGTEVTAHCPNPGRMTSCLAPEAPCRVTHRPNPRRKLAYTLEQVQVGGWIVVNTAMANRVVGSALRDGRIPELQGYGKVAAEVRCGEARLDFGLEDPDRPPCWVEVKTVTLLDEEVLRFPDAVSARATRHVQTLNQIRAEGHRAVLLFLIGRSDGACVAPAEAIDPTYAQALREAAAAGVEVLAYRMTISATALGVGERLPVRLGA